jgi:hypothetical protein
MRRWNPARGSAQPRPALLEAEQAGRRETVALPPARSYDRPPGLARWLGADRILEATASDGWCWGA